MEDWEKKKKKKNSYDRGLARKNQETKERQRK